ncbi:hypothetical protein ACLOJK_021927 [Asimina triloba]
MGSCKVLNMFCTLHIHFTHSTPNYHLYYRYSIGASIFKHGRHLCCRHSIRTLCLPCLDLLKRPQLLSLSLHRCLGLPTRSPPLLSSLYRYPHLLTRLPPMSSPLYWCSQPSFKVAISYVPSLSAPLAFLQG